MESNLGSYLQSLRLDCAVSAREAAKRADISPSTLHRWESGQCQPRIAELKRFLLAVEASSSQYDAAFKMLDAPRAIETVRNVQILSENVEISKVSSLPKVYIPASGDLWRALRRRAGLTARQVARELHIAPCDITRWEQSRRLPPEDRLNDLFLLFAARPEERMALTERQLLGAAIGEATESLSVEACEQLTYELGVLADNGKLFAGDLYYMLLERRLGQIAATTLSALPLLLSVYEWHAEWLQRFGRWKECCEYMRRVLRMTEEAKGDLGFSIRCVAQAAYFEVYGSPRPSIGRGIKILNYWEKRAKHAYDLSGIYRDMANLEASRGNGEDALYVVNKAAVLALKSGHPGAINQAQFIKARSLIAANRSEEALSILESELETSDLAHRVNMILPHVEALLSLGEVNEARHQLTVFQELVETFHYDHLLERAKPLMLKV